MAWWRGGATRLPFANSFDTPSTAPRRKHALTALADAAALVGLPAAAVSEFLDVQFQLEMSGATGDVEVRDETI